MSHLRSDGRTPDALRSVAVRAFLLVLAPALATAQTPSVPRTFAVFGTVYDSVANAPLYGAIVQVARIPSVDSAPRIVTALTDNLGHYRVGNLATGRYVVGFQHDALYALGLESPLRAFEFGADSTLVMDLGIASGSNVRKLRCGNRTAGSDDGMLAGYLLDARQHTPIAGATVQLHWLETAVQRGGLRTVEKRIMATPSIDGAYLVCGVPSDATLDVAVTYAGYRAVSAQISIPLEGAQRQDFLLADSGVVKGAASIVGCVRRDSSAVAAGRASIAALGVEVQLRDGVFTMSALPAGTWYVQVKSLGMEPQSALVNAIDGAKTEVMLSMVRSAQTLEAVSVIGKAGRETRILDDIVSRSMVAHGTTFMPGNSWLRAADFPS